MDEAGLGTIVPGTKPNWEVGSCNEETSKSDLKTGRGGDDRACLDVDPELADRGGAACDCDTFADTSTPDNTRCRECKDKKCETLKPQYVPNLWPEDDCFRTFVFLRASCSAMNSVRVCLRFSEVAPFEDGSLIPTWSPFEFDGRGESVVD